MDLQNIYIKSPIFIQQLLIAMWGVNEHKNRFIKEHDDQLAWLREKKDISVDEYFAIENSLLRKIISYSYDKVPAYKRKMDEVGILPQDIQTRADLLKLPVTTKDEVKSDYDSFISSEYDKKSLLVHFTSGSTGTPMRMYRDKEFHRRFNAYISFFREDMGIRLKDPRISFGGKLVVPAKQKKPPFWRFNPSWNQLYFSPYHMSEQNMSSYIEKIIEHKPKEILGYASAITLLAKHVVERKITGIRPNAVFTNSEPFRDWQRSMVEEAFACPVREWYSTVEYLFFAKQCSELNYHFLPGLGAVEVITDGREAKSGEVGELYATTLLNYASPLIRYKLLDSVMLGTGDCPCGSKLPFLSEIIGRTDDLIATPDGNFLGMGYLIFQAIPDLLEGQLIQESYDKFTVYLVPGSSWEESNKKAFLDRFFTMYPYKADVDIRIVDSVPRSGSGKVPNIISRINRDNKLIRKEGFSHTRLVDMQEK